MFCPDCGAADQIPNGYCKRCGEWLVDPQLKRRVATGDPLGRINTMMGFSAISAVMSLSAAVMLALTYFGSPEARWSVFVTVAMCAIIGIHQTMNFFFAFEFRQTIKARRDNMKQPRPEVRGATTAALESGSATEFVRPSSVTDHTTELLEPVPRTHRNR